MKIRIRNALFGLMSGLLLLAAGTPSAFAQQCPVSTGFAQVSGGDSHSLGIGPDGSLWSWGSNGAGALGLGDGTTITTTAIPQQVGTDTDWVTVEAGRLSSLAIKSDGTLWAWGLNSEGQLGDGTNTNRLAPVQIGTADNWESLSTSFSNAGGLFSVGVRTDGTLWAWGANFGRLGLGAPAASDIVISPRQVGTDTDWASVSAGGGFGLALKTNGALWAWGFNTNQQLGNGGTIQSPNWAPGIVGSKTWTSVKAGANHGIGIDSDGTLWSWGSNQNGQLGNGGGSGIGVTQAVPAQISAATDWVSISAGVYDNMALTSSGELWVWGTNLYGNLGPAGATPINTLLPFGVGTEWDTTDWARIETGFRHSFAFKSDDTLWGWGLGTFGRLGGAPGGSTPGLVSVPVFPCPIQDSDDDGVNDDVDMCPLTAVGATVDTSGCSDADVDLDGDGICDSGAPSSGPSACTGTDNCPIVENNGQEDADMDGVGDACDSDDDNDGVPDTLDNCPLTQGPLTEGGDPDQTDTDMDGAGDICDDDLDGDGVDNDVDVCPNDPDPDQTNTDGLPLPDGGDACDANDDNDDYDDVVDNCPLDVNNGQEDLDGDNIGDVCDADLDGDGVNNEADNCPITLGGDANQTNTDGDTEGDVCDTDDDNDTILDGADNCPLAANTSQSDTDGDGIGDACNSAIDDDGDNWSDTLDNCPMVANGDQADLDGDMIGDACDPDIDGDGVDNDADSCAATPSDEVSDFSGCTIAQLCPCDGPQGTTSSWKNHGKYVSCAAHAANDFRDAGLIFDSEHGDIVSAAGQSACGVKIK